MSVKRLFCTTFAKFFLAMMMTVTGLGLAAAADEVPTIRYKISIDANGNVVLEPGSK